MLLPSRYPIVERAVSGVSLLSDPGFAMGIKESVRKILQEDRRAAGQRKSSRTLCALRSLSQSDEIAMDDKPTTNGTVQAKTQNPSAAPRDDGNESDGSSSAESMDIEEYSSD